MCRMNWLIFLLFYGYVLHQGAGKAGIGTALLLSGENIPMSYKVDHYVIFSFVVGTMLLA